MPTILSDSGRWFSDGKGSSTDFAVYFDSCHGGLPRIGAHAIDWGGRGWVGGGRMITFLGLGRTFDSTS